MVEGEILFEWEPGEPILLRLDYEEVTPQLHNTVNKQPKGNVGHDIIVFGEEGREIIEDNESPDDSGGEWKGQDNKDEM